MNFQLSPSLKNNYTKLFVLVFTFAFFCSEGRQITGRVLDKETQKPVRNANVIVFGTTQGTITNFLGFFSINVEEQHKELVISSIGYFTSKIEIPTNDQFKILLEREYLPLIQLDLHRHEQTKFERPETIAATETEKVIERNAEYPGGLLHLINDLGDILKTEGLSTVINDSVLNIKFTVTTEGGFNVQYQSTPPEILSALSVGVKDLPKWTPAMQNNLAVEQHFTLPVKWSKNMELQEEFFSVVEVSASPKNGYPAFYRFIGENIKYPANARRLGVEGKVFVEFIVNRDGSLTDLKVIKGIGGGCDGEALRMISLSPNWNPGTQRGLPVRQKMVIPITFSLGGIGTGARPEKTDGDIQYRFYDWVSGTIRYPATARRMGIEGWIYALLTVNKNTGEIHSYKLLKDIGEGCGEEVLRVLSTVSPEAITKLNPSKEILVLPVGFGLDKITKKPDATPFMNEGVEILNPVEVVAVGVERERRVLGYPDAGFNPATSITIPDRSKPLPPQSFSEAPKKSTSLSFAGKNMEVIPTEIGSFKNLKFLDLENNLITQIPEEFGQLEKLQEFYIPINKLKELPTSFDNLQNLKILGLAQNEFTGFPHALTKLVQLNVLDLANNKLKELPASFGNLQNLNILGLAQNEFTGFPHALTKLVKLIALDLANNKIKNLPSEINQLKDLQELYLQNNELTALPVEIFELTKLKKLYLEGNPINERDKAILKQRLDKTEIQF